MHMYIVKLLNKNTAPFHSLKGVMHIIVYSNIM